ncbi:uncharacterized protein A4U43_C04F33290 [Asparagus officinalis]|uniref:Uncharacterized protein n=1 Tax=Asparagus officinalis TaxID=4686 RepID=A0A5P1F882_ASPOF|nr:uncharacterized protein A4U43_C04F33290 [Asparagus officinalis]
MLATCVRRSRAGSESKVFVQGKASAKDSVFLGAPLSDQSKPSFSPLVFRRPQGRANISIGVVRAQTAATASPAVKPVKQRAEAK